MNDRLNGDVGGVEAVLRARIWCDTRLPRGSWCCDTRGVFWFSSMDDLTLFVLTWA